MNRFPLREKENKNHFVPRVIGLICQKAIQKVVLLDGAIVAKRDIYEISQKNIQVLYATKDFIRETVVET